MGPKLLVHWLSTREQTDPQTLELDVDRYIANIDNNGEPGSCCPSAPELCVGALHAAALALGTSPVQIFLQRGDWPGYRS